MNLHEECLIKFLQQPDSLSHTTDVLKLNNSLFQKKMINKLFIAKNFDINYTTIR